MFFSLLIFSACMLLGTNATAQKGSKKKEPKEIKPQIPDTSAEDMPVPDPTGLVSDFGNVLTQGQEDTLNLIIQNFKDSTKDEIAIIAWDTLHLVPEDMDAYVHKIGQAWEIGEAGKGNGIIIAFSVQLRKIKIESVTGGLNEKDTWQIVHKIMLPDFANKNYYLGVRRGLAAVMAKLNEE